MNAKVFDAEGDIDKLATLILRICTDQMAALFFRICADQMAALFSRICADQMAALILKIQTKWLHSFSESVCRSPWILVSHI